MMCTFNLFYLCHWVVCLFVDDSVYLPDERERQEYVMNEHGLIYRGTSRYFRPMSWEFGQVSILGGQNLCILLFNLDLISSGKISDTCWLGVIISDYKWFFSWCYIHLIFIKKQVYHDLTEILYGSHGKVGILANWQFQLVSYYTVWGGNGGHLSQDVGCQPKICKRSGWWRLCSL